MSICRRQRVPEHKIFPRQPGTFKAVLDGVQDLRHPKGLEDEVGGAGAQGLDGGVQVGKRGDQNHMAAEALFAQGLEPGHAALARQRNVQNDQVNMLLLQALRAFFGAACHMHTVAARRQGFEQKVAHAGLVVHDQNRPVRPAIRRRVGHRIRQQGWGSGRHEVSEF